MPSTIDKMRHWMYLLGWESTLDRVGNHRYVVCLITARQCVLVADDV